MLPLHSEAMLLGITAVVAVVLGMMAMALGSSALRRWGRSSRRPLAWEAAVSGMVDAIIVFDRGGRIVDLNPAAESLVGRRRDVKGSEAVAAFARWPALSARLERIGDPEEAAFELIHPDSNAIFTARISTIGRNDGWVLVLRDTSAVGQAEGEQLRMLREQAALAEAVAASRAKDRFLATLSHELRTPLSPILTTVAAHLERPETPESLRPALEMIRRNVNLEVRLIDDLLDLTRIRGGKLHLRREVVDTHELIHRVTEICRDDLQKARLRLVLDLDAHRQDVYADPIRLQQVLWNLLKNAIKFTPAGGTITIRTRDADADVDVDAEGPAGRLIIEVNDTGIGIDSSVLPRIFDLYEQGDVEAARQSGGLGLGLTISRSIVEQHGGRLTATSAGHRRGSTFIVELPTAPTPETVPTLEPLSSEDEAAGRRPLRILLVDDNDDTRESLAELLELRGHEVHTAAGVASALRLAAEIRVDLVISDIELADGTGFQLISALRSQYPIAAIALSGLGSSDDLELSRSAGFAMHLMKPIDLPALEAAIERVAHRPAASLAVE